MSNFWDDTLTEMSRQAGKLIGTTAGASADTLRRGVSSGQKSLRGAYQAARRAKQGKHFLGVARTAASGPVAQVAYLCGRAGAAGAIVDGAVGWINAAKYMRDGKIDGRQAATHVAAESGCGFVTSASGTAGTIAVYMLTGSMGPAAMAVGMGASIGSRYAYRQVVGETLPEEDQDQTDPEQRDSDGDSGVIEDIGPEPQD